MILGPKNQESDTVSTVYEWDRNTNIKQLDERKHSYTGNLNDNGIRQTCLFRFQEETPRIER